MTLGYSIVWFDDSKDYISSLEPQIKGYLKDLGYALDLTARSDDSDLTEVMKKNVDLIMVDDNLGRGEKGLSLVKAIRDSELYTEVILYSQHDEFLSKMRQQLQGIFYAKRDNLPEETRKAINRTIIKKNRDINNIRGLFIAETIYIARQMEEIISKILKLSGDEREFFDYSIVGEEFFTDKAKYLIIRDFLKQRTVSLDQEIGNSQADKKDSLIQLKSKWVEVANIFKTFGRAVIELRNDLAHAKGTQEKINTLKIKNKEKRCFEGKEFGDEECKRIRQSFIKHSQNLKKLDELLGKL